MKILLQINSVVNWGSTGRIVEDIAQVATQSGWKTYVIYGRKKGNSASQIIKMGNKWSFIWHWFLSRGMDLHGLASKNATKKIISFIDQIKPDIIHLHNIHGYYINYSILFEYLSRTNIPVVWTLHDCWAYTGHCSHYDFYKCTKWQTLCEHCSYLKSYPKSLGWDHSKANYLLKKKSFTSIPNMTIVTVSHWLATEVRLSFLNKYPVDVIYNGLDLDVFKINASHKEKYIPINKFLILGVASVWNDRKGLSDFIKLSNSLPSSYKIILVGLSKKQVRSLSPNIVGITRTENIYELAELYSSADVFFNPTWEDNFPTTNIEALACGTPVITYSTGGSIEAINVDTGFVVKQGDMVGVMSAIEQIREKGKNAYIKACRDRAKQYYDKHKQYNKYLQLYKAMINKK